MCNVVEVDEQPQQGSLCGLDKLEMMTPRFQIVWEGLEITISISVLISDLFLQGMMVQVAWPQYLLLNLKDLDCNNIQIISL